MHPCCKFELSRWPCFQSRPCCSRWIFEAVSPFWTELDVRTVLGKVAVRLILFFFSPGICPFVTRFLLAETTAYEDRWCIPRDRKKRQALALQVMVNQLQRYSATLSLIRGSWGISCELEVDLQNHSCLWFQENFLALTTPRTGWRWWSRLMEGDRSQFMTWMADE